MSAYSDAVLADSPAGYWRMDEASGNIQDSSGNANHATSVTGAGFTYSEAGAIASDAASTSILFTPNSKFNVPDAATLDVGDVFSIEFWWKFNVNLRAQWPFSKQANGYELRINASDEFELVKAAATLMCTSTSVIPDDAAFHHIVATKTGATIKLWLDKVDVTGAISNATVADNASVLFIGGYNAGANQFADGWMDEIALYPTALSAARVAAHFDAAQTVAAARNLMLLGVGS